MYTLDDELVKKSQEGNIEAFEKLIARHEKRVYSIAYRYMGNREDAEDMAQEVLVRVYRSLCRFRGESSFTTWIYHIAANVCCDALRKKSRRRESSFDAPIMTDDGEIQREVVDWSLSPEPVVERKEQAQFLIELINQLSPEYRAVVVMREIQGFSYEEIAYQMRCSLGTVKSRLNRARRALRERIEASGELKVSEYRLAGQKEERSR